MDQIIEFIFSRKRELFELIKIVVGSFLGFGFALWSARLLDYRKRKREHLVAGNVALFTLKNQYNDFLLFRRDFRENVARSELTGNEPIWALLQPTFLQIDDSKIDFNSIGFLFENGKNAATINALQYAQILHRDLLAQHGKRNEWIPERQKAVARVRATQNIQSFEEIEKEVGPELISRVTALTCSLADRASRNEEKYLKAYDALWVTLTASRQGWWDRNIGLWYRKIRGTQVMPPYLKLGVTNADYKIEDLPELPNSLKTALSDGETPAFDAPKSLGSTTNP